MAQEVYHHVFDNGLTLLAERMEDVRSAAVNFLIPSGYVFDPPEHRGMATVLSEWITRGAGDRDSRELTLALDNLGLSRSESVGSVHTHLWAATLAANLPETLELYADIVLRPRLPEEDLEPVQMLVAQDILSVEDDPRQKVMIALRSRYYPHPLGLDSRGTLEGIQGLTPQILRDHHQKMYQANGAIISVAGNIEWSSLRDQIGKLFGSWTSGDDPAFDRDEPERGHGHLAKETTQTQIALAYPSVPFSHKDYYVARGAVSVLSGGMSGRLFTEVREKHGLCYAVSASYHSYKDIGAILCYAGTTNDRAQQTLDVTLRELNRLGEGIEEDEVERVKAGLKSALIMQEESTSARAGALASDWYYLGRVRSPEEIQSAVDSLTPDTIADYARRYPPANPTLVTLGPEPLKIGAATEDIPVTIS